jgi:hypothetical protein
VRAVFDEPPKTASENHEPHIRRLRGAKYTPILSVKSAPVNRKYGKILSVNHYSGLTLLDYGISIFGAVGILLFLGMFSSLPPLILFFFWGWFSIGICLLSVLLIVQNALFKFSRKSEWRTYSVYFGFNIIPAISFLVWQAGKRKFQLYPAAAESIK